MVERGRWLAALLLAGGLGGATLIPEAGNTMRHGWYVNAGLKQSLPLQTGLQHYLVIPAELPGYAIVAQIHRFASPCTAYRIARLFYARVHKAVYYLPTPTDTTDGPLAAVGTTAPVDFSNGGWTLRNYGCNSSGRGYDFTPTPAGYGATHYTIGFCGRPDGGTFTVEQYVDAGGGSWSWQSLGSGDTIKAAADTYNERTTFTLLQSLRAGSKIRVRWASGGWARLTWAAATWGADDAYPADGDAVVWKETADLLPLGAFGQALEPTQGLVVSGNNAWWGSYNHSAAANGNTLLVNATHTLNIGGITWTPAVGYFDDWRSLVMAGKLTHYSTGGTATPNIRDATETWQAAAFGVEFKARIERDAPQLALAEQSGTGFPAGTYRYRYKWTDGAGVVHDSEGSEATVTAECGGFTVTWPSALSAGSVALYRQPQAGGSYQLVASDIDPTAGDYHDTTVDASLGAVWSGGPDQVMVVNSYPTAFYGLSEDTTVRTSNGVVVVRNDASASAYPFSAAGTGLAYFDVTSPSLPLRVRVWPRNLATDAVASMRRCNVGATGPSTMRGRLMLDPLSQADTLGRGNYWQVGALLEFRDPATVRRRGAKLMRRRRLLEN